MLSMQNEIQTDDIICLYEHTSTTAATTASATAAAAAAAVSDYYHLPSSSLSSYCLSSSPSAVGWNKRSRWRRCRISGDGYLNRFSFIVVFNGIGFDFIAWMRVFIHSSFFVFNIFYKLL